MLTWIGGSIMIVDVSMKCDHKCGWSTMDQVLEARWPDEFSYEILRRNLKHYHNFHCISVSDYGNCGFPGAPAHSAVTFNSGPVVKPGTVARWVRQCEIEWVWCWICYVPWHDILLVSLITPPSQIHVRQRVRASRPGEENMRGQRDLDSAGDTILR